MSAPRLTTRELEKYLKENPDQAPTFEWQKDQPPPKRKIINFGIPGKHYMTLEEWYEDYFRITMYIYLIPPFGIWETLEEYQRHEYTKLLEAIENNPNTTNRKVRMKILRELLEEV